MRRPVVLVVVLLGLAPLAPPWDRAGGQIHAKTGRATRCGEQPLPPPIAAHETPVGSGRDAPGGATTHPTIPAAWSKHEVELAYQGFTTRYSCEGAKEKVRVLLRWFGARPDTVGVRAHGCAGGPYRPSPAINLTLEFETLKPVPASEDQTTVPAEWVERALFGRKQISGRVPTFIGRGDCELVQRFVAIVLPAFTHEILQNFTRCIPNQLDGTTPGLRVRVLVPSAIAGESGLRPRT